ncbi:hypothetical protein CK556_01370 [Mesoplasma chauliocola]|uniref:Lipoprotein n=1 Tax=Mesoplasma chauliocola TaxID=216427 RepID=A0A249SMV2_9MOLU|nr:lipoprotein [Mesoplasma chauliocola]ASZ09005.1 hypothetical protein CK556_01370 [Mesoplasma chauliocola]
MRKLIAILAAVGLTATTSTVVVSCANSVDRFNKLNFSDTNIYKTLIIKMRDNGLISVSEAQKFLSITDTEIIADVIKILDKNIADEEFKETSSSLASTLKVKNEAVDSRTNILLRNLANNQFFTEYTSAIIKAGKAGVNEYDYMGTGFNPKRILKNDTWIKYSIYFKAESETTYKRWQTEAEHGKEQTPTIDELNNGKFFIVGNAKDETINSLPTTKKVIGQDEAITTSAFLAVSSDQGDGSFNGNDIMQYRFQSYINSKIVPELYSQLISLTYLDSNLLTTNWTSTNYANSFVRLDTTNKLVTSMQNSLISSTKQSNVKLIWSIKTDVSDSEGTPTDFNNWVRSYKELIKGSSSQAGNIELNEGELQKLLDAFKDQAGGEETTNVVNTTQLGADPFFGLKGYNGIVMNNDTGVAAISGNLEISTTAQTDAKAITRPTILTGNDEGYEVGDAGEREIVLVLPLYLNDIYDNSSISLLSETNGDINMSIPANTWIPLADKYSPAIDNVNIVSETKNIEVIYDTNQNAYIKLNDKATSGEITLGETIKHKVNIKVEDEPTTLGVNQVIDKTNDSFTRAFSVEDAAKVGETDKILYSIGFARNPDPRSNYNLSYTWNNDRKSSSDIKGLSANSKQLLLSEIENGIVKSDTDYTTEAKTELYTKYIMEGDNVLYQGLYDELAKYIKDETSGESN